MATIATMHIGLSGHVGPLSRLGAELARQGHRVLAWAPERYRDQIESGGVELTAHEPITRREMYGGLPGFTANLAQATERCIGDLVDALFEHDVDLVIHDSHAPWGLVAAEFLGLPRIVSDPLFPIVDPKVLSAAARDAEQSGGKGFDIQPRPLQHAVEFYPGGLEAALKQVEASRLTIGRAWGVDIGDWRSVMRCRGDVTVSYTIPEILGRLVPAPGWCCVGPLMVARPRPTRPRLSRPRVYIAFGTFFNWSRHVFATAIEALADEPVEVVVSTGRGWVSPADLEPLPANVTIHTFVDSQAVLAEADAHITHGGGSSVSESLLAGVPLICVPQGSDQAVWSYCVSELGAGEVVEGTAEAIQAGIRRLLDDDAPRRRAQEVGQRLAEFDGASCVADVVRYALGQELGGRGVSSASARG